MIEPRTACAGCPITPMLLALHRAEGQLILCLGDKADTSPTLKAIRQAIEDATGRRA